MAFELLRRHEARRAHEEAVLREVLAVAGSLDDLADAEVDDLDDLAPVALRHEEDVRRLEIAVDDPARVRLAEAAGDLPADDQRVADVEEAVALQARGERLSGEELHRDEVLLDGAAPRSARSRRA
ncbi:MAG: hypothetical protein QM702_21230 [Rubrivivax sp.]